MRYYNDRIREYKIVFWDERGVIYFTNAYYTANDPSQISGCQGVKLSRFYADPWTAPNKDKTAGYMVHIELSNAIELNEHIFAVQTGRDLQSYFEQFQVQDILLTKQSVSHNKVTFSATLGGVNIVNALPDIADVACFVAKNRNVSSIIAITDVAIINNQLRVILDALDTNYIVGNTCDLTINTVRSLASNGFEYYASNTISFTIVA